MKTLFHWLFVMLNINYEEAYWTATYERDLYCHIISNILEKNK